MLGRLTRHSLHTWVAVLVTLVGLSGVGIAAYLAHIYASATALINSVREIHTKADAEREIASWRKRWGKDFWEVSDHPGGDKRYDARIVNTAIARLRVVEPTGVIVSITMRDGKLRCVTVIEATGWYPVASVFIQEWFDEGMQNRFHVGSNRKPSTATVEFPASMPEAQRRRPFAVNSNCLVKAGGCKSAEDMLPGVWQLETGVGPE